ncbi:MAG TPA: FliH/SctL family protein [Candidatus Eremiobacteraceae bacterium]|nr:FliH/SctL family protein [Candidatus Eremiobacteraceae bacterium]
MTADGFAPFVPRVVIARRLVQETPPELDTDAVEEEVLPELHQIDLEKPAEVRDDEANCRDEARTAASVRERATKIAGEACARALREAIARNPLFVARFVDDAMEVAGQGSGTTVRLSPVDAAACRDRVAASVAADETLASGDVVVETAHGIVSATVDQRARLLARAVADSS